MPGSSYLVDSNVLLRWIKPDDRDYPLVVSAIELSRILEYLHAPA
jgi:hypothetical protein